MVHPKLVSIKQFMLIAFIIIFYSIGFVLNSDPGRSGHPKSRSTFGPTYQVKLNTKPYLEDPLIREATKDPN